MRAPLTLGWCLAAGEPAPNPGLESRGDWPGEIPRRGVASTKDIFPQNTLATLPTSKRASGRSANSAHVIAPRPPLLILLYRPSATSRILGSAPAKAQSMLSTPRRSLLGSLAALSLTPALIRASSLMPLSTAEVGDTYTLGSTSWDWLVADMGRELRRRLSQRLDVIGHQPSNVTGKQVGIDFELFDKDLRLSQQ